MSFKNDVTSFKFHYSLHVVEFRKVIKNWTVEILVDDYDGNGDDNDNDDNFVRFLNVAQLKHNQRA